MDIGSLLVSLISGVVGGNVAGAALPDKSLGALGNSLSGLVGGGIGGSILQALGVIATQVATGAGTAGAAGAASGLDIGSLLGNIGGSGVSGAILMIIVSLIKNAMSQK
ncbi:MAG: hypothetical protein LLG04_06525 [Parachlamydia sp.]|nr:hypothetical protein [Parachlamydia sp.]